MMEILRVLVVIRIMRARWVWAHYSDSRARAIERVGDYQSSRLKVGPAQFPKAPGIGHLAKMRSLDLLPTRGHFSFSERRKKEICKHQVGS
jgi:hypothetical protein